jgi:ATP-dependent DNA helicase DinG
VAPIDVAPTLEEQVFSKLPVILTSATVPLGLAVRLGADPGQVDELDVGSPFAYEQNALLYCAAHLPDRRKPEAEAAIVEEVAALITAAGGRTLALFTSRAAMQRVADAVRSIVSCPVIAQGEQSKAALIDTFTSQPETCLFATMGFWQGVDVPGPTLALVVIDRIPFARPDDPLAAARRDRAGDAAFRLIDLPRAAGLLAQGAGRLVRTADDRGVVAVLDSRLATASYRWDLVRALPPMRRTKVRAEAEELLRAIHSDASRAERPEKRSGRPARRQTAQSMDNLARAASSAPGER